MAQRHHDRPAPVTGEALAAHLRAQAREFLHALRPHRESAGWSGGAEGAPNAVRALRRAARRITAGLHTYRPLLDPAWSEEVCPELAWLSGTLAAEYAYEARLHRLLTALHRLSGGTTVTVPGQLPPTPRPDSVPDTHTTPTTPTTHAPDSPTTRTADTALTTLTPPAPPAPPTPPPPDRGTLAVGAAKAGALLERRLTLARTRAHSTALQALGSSRFHAVADKVALLAGDVPLTADAATTDLRPLAAAAEDRLTAAVAALPLVTAGHPYNAEALVHGLAPEPAAQQQDAPWHQVRLLLRLHRYAREVVHTGTDDPAEARLRRAEEALDRHRDAAEAAAAAAQAARTPRIAPATAYALGVLHADQRHEVEAARYAFQRCWLRHRGERPGT
ncbi:CHAD domain-containing protein [Streptomyces sp. NPDC006186]|uniref:CHAD domain-containing protein n=1 Tax=Streptomyces sp. NPDC006186 TaxID=3155248 RepID=UPI0033A11736